MFMRTIISMTVGLLAWSSMFAEVAVATPNNAQSQGLDPRGRAQLMEQIDEALEAKSEGFGVSMAFDAGGLRLTGRSSDDETWSFGLRILSYGRAGAMSPATAGRLQATDHRSELERGPALREWVSRAGKVWTQGFILAQPPHVDADGAGPLPAEAGSGDLLFDLEISGTFEATLANNGGSLQLRQGQHRLAYHNVSAVDATGRQLPARLELHGSHLRLRVDDHLAILPLAVTADVDEIKKLVQPTAQLAEGAGWSVALDGDTAVVGARFADVSFLPDAGKAYIFQRDKNGPNQWGLVKEISASEPGVSYLFGSSVAIDGDRIAVGAAGYDDFLVPDSGRAFVFERHEGGLDNWGEVARIPNPTPELSDLFGWNLALEGPTLVVGAFGANIPLIIDAGEAYVFNKDSGGLDTWGLVKTLQAPTPMAVDWFGHDVAIEGDTLVVSAILGEVGPAINTGAAYIYSRNSGGPEFWGLVTTITAADGQIVDRFGDSVAISGDTVVVGADFDDGVGIDSGSAYVFERNFGGPDSWGQSAKLVASDQAAADYFGWAVDIEGDTILVGSHYDDSPLINAGSAYLFGRDEGGIGAWGEIGQITPDVGAVGDDFGIAVALSGESILVGADLDSEVQLLAGAAYIFELADAANLVITMNDETDPVPAGGLLTYNVTVENFGPDTATDVQVTHMLPNEVSSPVSVGCAEDGAWVGVCSLGPIASGATAQYTVTVTVNLGATGLLSHVASVASAVGDPSPLDNTVTVTTLIGGGGGGSADLLILKKDSVDPVAPGAPLTYTLDVLNNGPDEALDVIVTEILPAGVSGATTSGCNNDPNGLPICELGNILPAITKTYTVSVTVDAMATGPLVNTATVSASTDDPVSQNNTASEATVVGLGTADLLILMDDTPDPLTAGALLTYTVRVDNSGPDPAPATFVELGLPASVSSPMSIGCAEDPAGDGGCSLGEIAPGSSASFTVTVVTDPLLVDPLVATATVTSSAADPIPLNNTTTEETTVEAVGEANLYVFQTAMDPVEAGTSLSYTVIIGNHGPAAASNVLLTTVVDNFAIVPSATGCTGGVGVPTCELGTIQPGDLRVVTVMIGVRADANGTLVNEVMVSSANDDPDTSNNTATETTTVVGAPGMADLMILVDDTPDPATPGEAITYMVTVINLGPHQAQGVAVSSMLPAAVANVVSSGCSEDPAGGAACTLGILDLNGSVTFTLSGDIDINATGPLSFSATVNSDTDDSQAANNVVNESTVVETINLADLSISLVEDQDPVAPGTSVVYTVTVENLGTDDATAVVVSGSIAEAVGTVVSSGCNEDPAGLVSCTLGTVAAGNTASFTLEVPIPANTSEESITLTVSVNSSVVDPVGGNNMAAETTTINGEPPTVENLDSVGDTGDATLATCEEARVPIDTLLVTFSAAMNNPAGDSDPTDVTNPMAYQLVATGPDRKLSTQQCSALLDDDVLVPVTAVTYDDGSLTAGLGFGSALPDGPYRLLICGDALAASTGVLLDGDDDGNPGGDWKSYFRIETKNLFTNGHFDCSLEGWSEVATSENEITYSAFDVDSALESGASVVYQFGSTPVFSLGQCVPVALTGEYNMTGSIWLRDLATGDSLEVTRTCEFYAQAGCLGSTLGNVSNTEVLATTTTDWDTLQPWSWASVPGSMSAICSVDMRLLANGGDLTVLLDDLFLSDHIFSNGFESGDLSAWSLSMGN